MHLSKAALVLMHLSAAAAATDRLMHHPHCPMVSRARAAEPPDDFNWPAGSGPAWFQTNWEPHLSCMEERRVGTHGDGGKWLCDPDCLLVKDECIVYSIGSSNEFSFDAAMVARGCTVHTFDHTVANPNPPPGVVYHKMGLGTPADAAPFKSAKDIFAELNHTKVDVFKMDIEGGEYKVLLDEATLAALSEVVVQMQIEFHYGWGAAQGAPSETQRKVAELMTKAGFYAFHKEPNIQFSDGGCIEYAFLNTRKVFGTSAARRLALGVVDYYNGWAISRT